jgi:glycerophosphoryl diester phosphodiesterase
VDTPLVFAHRGSSAALPEHTLAAYLRALEEGADGLECDVRLTRDGHLVCVHDRRLDRTSNGRGRVSRRTLAELAQLDFGSWHPGCVPPGDAEPVLADPDRTGLLTLAHLLDAVLAAGREVRLLIETKHPTRYGGEVERRLVRLLDEYGLLGTADTPTVRVTVMSFSPLAIRRIRELAPALPTVLLLETLPRWIRPGRLPFGIRIAGPGIALVRARPELVPTLRRGGHQVYVWTVNEAADVDPLLDLGVDGVITDRPALVLEHLRR